MWGKVAHELAFALTCSRNCSQIRRATRRDLPVPLSREREMCVCMCERESERAREEEEEEEEEGNNVIKTCGLLKCKHLA